MVTTGVCTEHLIRFPFTSIEKEGSVIDRIIDITTKFKMHLHHQACINDRLMIDDICQEMRVHRAGKSIT